MEERNTDELKKQVESRVKVFQLSKNNNIGWSVEKIDKEVKAGKINVSIISDVEFKKRIEGIRRKNQEEADKTRLKLNQERVNRKEEKRREVLRLARRRPRKRLDGRKRRPRKRKG